MPARNAEETPRPRNERASQRPARRAWEHVIIAAVIAAAGYAAVGPATRGGFLSGDDVHLLRDHVLVNHPSLAHAAELFTVVHRDLYQPLLLLSFQLDFLFRGGDPHGMHATNVWLHLLAAILVYGLTRQLTADRLVGGLAGLLFAVHPMAVESVAWLNGRTMLISTALVLAGLIAFDHWHRSDSRRWLVVALVLFIMTMMSKIRVELPALLILLLAFRRRWPDRRWCVGWSLATAIALGFSLFALHTTHVSEMIDKARVDMPGSYLARSFESLGWYFVHYVWPSGLSPWHPPRALVRWSDPSVLVGIGLCATLALLTVLLWHRTRTPAVGYAWFLAAIFSTLQIVPTRAVTAGERYAYLPIVGLHWIAAAGLAWVVTRLWQRSTAWAGAAVGTACVATLVCSSVFVSRHTTGYYRNDLAKAHRIAAVYPETPDVFKDLAWAYIRAGDLEQARATASLELDRPQSNRSAALQAIAWTYYLKQDFATAERYLLQARQADPDFGKVYYRLAIVHEALGRTGAAESEYRKALEITPTYLPALSDLALLYLHQGKLDEAEATYLRILREVNPYHMPAIYNLGDIYMTRGHVEKAAERYRSLLSWDTRSTLARQARNNLGLCLQRMGRLEDALAAYDRVLRDDPGFVEAVLNRASLLLQMGRPGEAERAYRRLLAHDPSFRPAIEGLQAILGPGGRCDELAGIWEVAARAEGSDSPAWAWVAWNRARGAAPEAALPLARQCIERGVGSKLAGLAVAWVAYAQGDHAAAEQRIVEVLAAEPYEPPEAIDALTAALEAASRQDPASPWPYYYVGLVMNRLGRQEVSRIAYREFLARCQDASWRAKAERALAGDRPPR